MSDTKLASDTSHDKVQKGNCPLCDHALSRHDKYGACDYIAQLSHLGHRLDICNCGHGERMAAYIQALQDKMDAPIPPLSERVEKLLKRSDPRLTSEFRQLLRDALSESETWFTMYQAWVKRATQAERELTAYKDRVTAALDAVDVRMPVCLMLAVDNGTLLDTTTGAYRQGYEKALANAKQELEED